jgi:Mg/Co/Ni transporter MgtE
VTLSPGDTLADGASEFSKYGFRALPMVDENRKLLGVIRYKDLLSVMQ